MLRRGRLHPTVLAAFVLALSPAAAPAQTNGTWISPASGNWSSATNWLGGNIADGGGTATFNDAFGQTGLVTVTIDTTSRTLSEIRFDSGFNYAIAASGGAAINMGAGGLTLNAVNTLRSSPVTFFAPNTISAPITGTGSLIKAGTGGLTVTGTNTFTGSVEVNQGTLFLGSNAAMGNAANGVTLNGGTFASAAAITTTRAFTVGANGGVLRPFGALALNGTLSGSGTLVKELGNPMSFGGDGTGFTGRLRIDAGTFTVNNAGVLGGTQPVEVGGTLALDNAGTNVANRLGGRPVVLRGATVTLAGNPAAASSEAAGELTLAHGMGNVAVTPNAATASTLSFASLTRQNNSTLFVRGPNLGATPGPGVANVTFVTAPAGLVGGGGAAGTTTRSILPFAFGNTDPTPANFNGGSFLALGANGLTPLAAAEYATSLLTAGPTDNVDQTAAATLTTPVTVNSLRLTPAANVTIDGTSQLTVTSGAILSTSSAATAPAVTVSAPVTAGSRELVVTSTNGATNTGLVLSGVISGTGGLTRTGPGVVTLTGANTYTGPTTLAGGLTVLGGGTVTAGGTAPSPLGQGTGPISLTSSGSTATRLWTSGNLVVERDVAVTLGGGSLTGVGTAGLSAAESLVLNGNVSLGNPAGVSLTGFLFSEGGPARANAVTFNGIVSGSGGLRANLGSYTILNGANTYSGGTVIGASGLQAGTGTAVQAVPETWEAGNDAAFGTGTIFVQAQVPAAPAQPLTNPGTLVAGGGPRTISNPVVFVNGIGAFAGSNPITLSGPVELNGSATNATHLTVGANSPVTMTGVVSRGGLIKAGPGALTLTAANQYGGQTFVREGVLSVASLGNGGTAGNLGSAPSAAGSVFLTGGSATAGATLRYTGPGETTDRLFTLAGFGGTIESSGSGPLVFGNTGTVGAAAIGGGFNNVTINAGAGVIALNNFPALAQVVVGTTINNTNFPAGTTITEVGPNWIRLSNASTNTSLATGQVLQFTAVPFASRTLTLSGTNAGSNTIAGVIADATNSPTALAKSGTGTWQVTNANTYSAGTTVSAGQLQVNNTTGSGTGTGTVTVEAAGTLAGTGRVAPTGGNAVTVSGRVLPGPAAGANLRIETATGAISFAAGSVLSTRILAAGPSAAADTGGSTLGTVPNPTNTAFLTLNSGGGINFDPGTIFEVDGTGVGFTANQPYSYQVGQFTGLGTPLNVTNAANFVAVGFAASGFSLTSNGAGAVFLNFTPVPEPATVLAVSAAALALGLRRRGRK